MGADVFQFYFAASKLFTDETKEKVCVKRNFIKQIPPQLWRFQRFIWPRICLGFEAARMMSVLPLQLSATLLSDNQPLAAVYQLVTYRHTLIISRDNWDSFSLYSVVAVGRFNKFQAVHVVLGLISCVFSDNWMPAVGWTLKPAAAFHSQNSSGIAGWQQGEKNAELSLCHCFHPHIYFTCVSCKRSGAFHHELMSSARFQDILEVYMSCSTITHIHFVFF